ncbi:beta strand repeat-containing protein [Uliginosibacterium sp. H1]|uniref:beta strand repeat-containing protein n=1 Tax=Uliginosibacterium sp. H1 TaxID=3114757 RepID=UPI002E19641E|nr:hypothetical protein [Uliginosibacterium sp. H1]
MSSPHHCPGHSQPSPALLIRAAFILLAAWLASAMPGSAHAAPAAGTNIGNQASATYSDSSATVRTVTSNAVVTVVQQVASLTLTSNGTRQVALGGLVSYPHTLTNTGNGNDSFTLAATNTGGNFNMLTILMYADANGDGVPDNATPITSSGTLAAGGVFRFVVVATVPPTAVATNTNTMTVTATSTFTPGQSASNTDTTTVSGNAVVNVTKSIDLASGAAGSGPRTFTLTYTNTGTGTATAVMLADVIPSGMTYVPGSGRWSGTGATTLSDADASDNQSGIVYDYNVTAGTRVTAVIASVPAGASGTLSFQVNINAGLAPGINPTTLNTATFSYNNGAITVPATSTNAVQFVVTQGSAVGLLGAVVPFVTQGGTASFTNTVTNNGNGVDSFDITLSGSVFPAGTSFVLFQADGVTPLLDTNANGIPDTGPMAAGASLNVILKATLPAGVSGGGPYDVTKTATSRLDPTKFQSATDRLTTITTSVVDITNNSAGGGAPGLGAGPEGSPVVTNPTSPGSTTRFTLYVANGSGVADAFNLQASTDSSFATTTLPAGWTVSFKDASDAVITNTGIINASSNRVVYADVTVPAGVAGGTTSLYFRARSPVTNATDTVHDAVQVGTTRGLTLGPNNSGQVLAGGSVTYTYTIRNSGNALEGGSVGQVVLGNTNTGAGFTSVVRWDRNNDGVLDPGDPVITDLSQLTGGSNGASTAAGLDAGESATLFVQVFAASGALPGTVDTMTLTATTTGTIGGVAAPAPVSATAGSSVIAGQVRLEKSQALDAACDGTADTPFSPVTITTGAVPGACVRYQVTATNAGIANVTSVVVSDATPPNTTYHATVAAATSQGSVTAPPAGTAGTVQAVVGTMTPGQVVTLSFGVRINP